MISHNRVKRITSHVGKRRYLRDVGYEVVGWIPRQPDIPSPYAYSSTHVVYFDGTLKTRVIVVETAHRRYDVFSLPTEMAVYKTDDEATNAFMKGA